jgi:type VI secretion system secreted protein VgrG
VKANTEHITLEANTDIVLKVGKSTLHMNADGSILIDGVRITINGSGRVDINPGGGSATGSAGLAAAVAAPAGPGGGAGAAAGAAAGAVGAKAGAIPAATKATLATPASADKAPKEVNFSGMQSDFDKQWASSFPGGKSQEHGGTIVSDASGNLKLANMASGKSGSFSPNLNVSKGESVEGVFHTHPYDKVEGGYTGVSLSGGDAAYLINTKQNVIVAQSGNDQFMYVRTGATPASVDAVALNNSQNARIAELTTKGASFDAATRQAAQETAKSQGLAYYEGSGGVLKRVYP